MIWSKLTQEEIKRYTSLSDQLLSKIKFDHDLLNCVDVKCDNNMHISAIDELYDKTISALKDASAVCRKVHRKQKDHNIQGWNVYVKEVHSRAREAFLIWRSNGSPRSGAILDMMNRTRSQFKLALRKCRADTDRVASDSLAHKLLKNDNTSFWKEVHKVSCSNTKI